MFRIIYIPRLTFKIFKTIPIEFPISNVFITPIKDTITERFSKIETRPNSNILKKEMSRWYS